MLKRLFLSKFCSSVQGTFLFSLCKHLRWHTHTRGERFRGKSEKEANFVFFFFFRPTGLPGDRTRMMRTSESSFLATIKNISASRSSVFSMFQAVHKYSAAISRILYDSHVYKCSAIFCRMKKKQLFLKFFQISPQCLPRFSEFRRNKRVRDINRMFNDAGNFQKC